jgi:hypothetical protein
VYFIAPGAVTKLPGLGRKMIVVLAEGVPPAGQLV